MSRNRALAVLALLLAPLVAAPAAATTCSADLRRLGSGEILVFGQVDEPAIRTVVIVDAAGRVKQYITIEDPGFAELLSFAMEAGDDKHRAVFVDGANEIWCVQRLVLRQVFVDSSDDGSTGTRGRANP